MIPALPTAGIEASSSKALFSMYPEASRSTGQGSQVPTDRFDGVAFTVHAVGADPVSVISYGVSVPGTTDASINVNPAATTVPAASVHTAVARTFVTDCLHRRRLEARRTRSTNNSHVNEAEPSVSEHSTSLRRRALFRAASRHAGLGKRGRSARSSGLGDRAREHHEIRFIEVRRRDQWGVEEVPERTR